MRIIIVSTSIGFLGSGKGGGVELTLNSLVSGLLMKGHLVKVIAPFKSKLSDNCNLAELVCVQGREQVSWQHQDYYASAETPQDSIVNALIDKALIDSTNYDVVINLSYDLEPISKTLESEVPIAHLISMGNESFAISNQIKEVYLKFPHNFAFHTKIQASDYPFIKKPVILGNGFQLSNYTYSDERGGPLGWVGRVSPEKGLEDAVYVANKLQERLNVWGYIEDEKYALMIKNLDSDGLVSWRGFLSTNRLQEELCHCRALINTPKWNEAYGNVVVEAMACGVPVVAYRRGGPSEIIQHGSTGFLVEPGNTEELLKYLKKINSLDRSKCRSWVENNASTNIFTDKVENWLQKIIKDFKN
tara:strand:- start:375 stop:1454 length:1080 start_codon:yes stop_codon:yes gene_type:complete